MMGSQISREGNLPSVPRGFPCSVPTGNVTYKQHESRTLRRWHHLLPGAALINISSFFILQILWSTVHWFCTICQVSSVCHRAMTQMITKFGCLKVGRVVLVLCILQSPTETLSATDFFFAKLNLNKFLRNTPTSNNQWRCAPQPQESILHSFHFVHFSDRSGLNRRGGGGK